jgi:hypothetical protein
MITNTLATYQSLITSEHSDKPKFMAFYSGCVQPLVDLQEFTQSLLVDFDVDSAVGVQLDAIGLWVGISRYLLEPITGIYYSVNGTVQEGVNYGILKGVFDSGTDMVRLNDQAYRILIRAKIAANRWDGSIPGAYEVWAAAFGPPGPGVPTLMIQDNQDMSMTVGIGNIVLSALEQALLLGGYIDLRPEGVRVKEYVIVSEVAPLGIWGNENSLWGECCWGITIVA